MSHKQEQANILGIKIDKLSKHSFLHTLDELLLARKPAQIVTVNPEFLVAAQRSADFKSVLVNSDLNIADGIGVVWAAKYLTLRQSQVPVLCWVQAFFQMLWTMFLLPFRSTWFATEIPERLSGSQIVYPVCQLAQDKGSSVFFLGGFEDTPELVSKKMSALYPKLKIAGSYAGRPGEQGLVERINLAKPDILLVAFGPVTQELWLAENLKKLHISVGIGLGGTFDYIAKKKPSAPHFLSQNGLEWAWRLITQPHRLARIYNAVVIFPWYCLLQKVIDTRPYRKNVVACVVNKQGQVLICKRTRRGEVRVYDEYDGHKEHWQLPQGGVSEGEDEEVAVRRELFEETGLKNINIVTKVESASTYEWPVVLALKTYDSRYKGQTQTLFFVRVDDDSPDIRLESAQFNDYRWIDKAELRRLIHPLRKNLADIIVKRWPETFNEK